MEYSLVATDEKTNGEASTEEFVPPVSIWKNIKHKKRTRETERIVGVFEVFRFLDTLDIFLMCLGTICAAVCGLGIPGLFTIVGDVCERFINVGSFENLLNSIQDYFQSINKTKEEVLANTSLLDCSAIQGYYGTKEKCLESSLHEGIFDKMAELALYISGLGLMVFVTQYIHVTCWVLTAERRAHRIRRACLLNVLRQEIGWFDTHGTAQLNFNLSEDIRKIQDGTGEKVGIFIQWCTTAVTCVTVGLLYGWKLALVLLVSTPVMIVTTVLYGKVAAAVSSKEQTAYVKAGAIAEEVLGAVRTVVAYGGQDKEAQRYKRNLLTAQKYGVKKGLVNGLSQGFNWLILYSFIGLGFWYGAKLTREDEDYDVSNVAIVVSVILSFAHALGMAAPSIPAFATARCAAHTIFELIDRKSQIDSLSEDGLKPKSVTGTIKFENVHFNYPSRPDVKVLNGFNLEVKQGQTVALVGSSGCGKSTVVQMVLRFYDPHIGKILIDGQDIRSLNVKWLRTIVGVVSQEPVLFGTTIAENIRYGREDVTMAEIEEATKTANAYDFIMDLPDKFETVVGERGSQLSGGQKQRLAIARALVRDPKILLLDEATSALDTESESIVQDALDKSRQGRTTVVVAHRLSTIKNADLVVGLDEGKVAEIGNHEALMEKQGIYYQLVMNQQTSTMKEDELPEDAKTREQSKVDTLRPMRGSMSEQNETEEETQEDLPKAPLTRLIKLAAPDWPILAMGLSGSVANGCVAPFFAVTMTRILSVFSYLDDAEQEEKIRKNVLLVLCVGLLSFVACFLQGYAFGLAGEALTKRLRDLSFRSMLKQEISFFDDSKNNVGALTTKLATDASLVQGIAGPRLGAVLMTLVNITAALSVAFYHGWKLTLVVLAFLPFMMITGVTAVKLLAGQAGENKKALEGAGKITVESVGNIKTVASLTIERTFLDLYMQQLEKAHKDTFKKSHIVGILFGFGLSIMFFAYATTFLYGAYLIEEGEMKFDDVFMVFYAVIISSISLGHATAFVPDLGKAQISARRIFQLLDLKSTIDYTSPFGTRLDTDYKANVTFKDVEFHYPNRKSVKVLQGTTLSVSPGQTVALIGSSGCGKSTSVQLIERFYDCDAGQVTLDNHNIKTLNVNWLREQIGIVSQEPVLFDTSIAENIAYGDNTRTISMDEIIAAARSANIHSFIASLPDGYNTTVGLRGAQLSGGQKQRIAIARAVVRNPKILLLDEATSALDTENEKVVQEALDKAREGRTCVVVAHRLSTVQNADNICVISNGKVTEIGSHTELMTKQGFYYKLVKNSIKE